MSNERFVYEQQNDTQILIENVFLSLINIFLKQVQKIYQNYKITIPIDIDILSDIYQCYNPNYSYSRTLLNIITQQFRKDHPIQSYFTTEESTLCVTLGGTAIFEFGSGQLILNKDTFETVEKNIFPEFIRIKSISCSDDYILVTTADGSLLQYGDQYRQIKFKPHYLNKECTMASKRYIVSENKVFSLFNLNHHIPIKQKAKMVSCGNQFIVTLCESGQLYSWGENYEGELGLGDRKYRHEPCLINIEKVFQVCCGFKHVIAKTRSKIYTWGWGERGQLGNSELKNEILPKPLNISALWVSAGRTSSSVITNDRIIMQCGTNSKLNHLERFEPQILSFVLNSMIPIRIISNWSKTIEITYVTFANTISLPDNQISKSLKILSHLNQIWSESSDPHSIDPPFNQSISNYLYEASMRKSNQFNKQQIKNHFKLQKEILYIEDDRDWAMKKKNLVEDIISHYKTITKTDKLKAIRQRFQDLITKTDHQLTNDDKNFINQIQNNEKIQALLKSLDQ